MRIDLWEVIKAGVIWGLVAIALTVVVSLTGRFLPAGVQGLTLGTYAVLFAGVHFAAGEFKTRVAVMGGALAGLVATFCLVAVGHVLPQLGLSVPMPQGIRSFAGPLMAGVAGAVGMELVKRLGRTTRS